MASHRLFVVAAALCSVALARPIAAQGSISAGQTVSGRLDASDRVRESDNTYYDDWFYVGRAGERITVTQRSSDFDSWLLIGRVVNGEFQLEEFNDDAAGGNDARIEYTLPTDGPYVIRVNVVGRGRTGAYTLTLTSSAGGGAPVRSSGGMMLSAGQSFTGALESSDPVWTDDTYYDLWRYNGRAGERVTIIMRSPSFSSYMQWGQMNGNEFVYKGGSTSRTIGGQQETVLDITLPATGLYGIRANSHGRHTGQYVLTVSSSGAIGAPSTSSSATINVGSTIRSTLTPADVQTDSGWYHEDYTFTGSRGQVIQVDLESDDFDTFIDLYHGTTWVAQDDDGGDGLDSRLVFTLPETGTYTICARSRYANRTGAYTLTLR